MDTSSRPIKLVALISGLFVALLISWSSITYTIPSGYAGLVFRTFADGINPDEAPVGQGFHFKAPWDKVVVYEIRQKEMQQKLDVLSSNLLKIQLDMTVFHEPVRKNLGALEIERGRDYEDAVIVPSMRSVSREVFAKYLPEEINTSKREQIQVEIEDRLREKLASNFIQLNDVLIRNIRLPKTLEEAIERKLNKSRSLWNTSSAWKKRPKRRPVRGLKPKVFGISKTSYPKAFLMSFCAGRALKPLRTSP